MNSHESRKLRLDKSALYRFLISLILAAAVLYFVIVVLDAAAWGPGLHTFDYFLLVLYTLLGTVQLVLFFRTRNSASLALGAALLLFIPYLFISLSVYSDFRFLFYLVWTAFLLIYGPLRRRFNPHYRQVLELAARPVTDLNDGFTQRPYPAGTVKFEKEEIINFANFLMRHWIATVHIKEDRVMLVVSGFSWRYLLFGKQALQNNTWVSLDYSGDVTVNIAKKDYMKFKDRLTFDQLCRSLGALMKRFFLYYQKGDAQKIVTVIDQEMTRSHWFFSQFTPDQQEISARAEG